MGVFRAEEGLSFIQPPIHSITKSLHPYVLERWDTNPSNTLLHYLSEKCVSGQSSLWNKSWYGESLYGDGVYQTPGIEIGSGYFFGVRSQLVFPRGRCSWHVSTWHGPSA